MNFYQYEILLPDEPFGAMTDRLSWCTMGQIIRPPGLYLIMTTAAKLLVTPSDLEHVRPFDVRRDLNPVANLIEQCFADTLDPDGQRYLHQMRSAARSPGYLRWAGLAAERAALPLAGYVWEEKGRLVGNLTLIPYFTLGQRYYLIANVAVHPDYRRRGVGRTLTLQAIQHARGRGAQSVWLHVREENLGAAALYTGLDFTERARRSTWQCYEQLEVDPALQPGISIRATAPAGLSLGSRRTQDWAAQRQWLSQLYPNELTWHLSLKMNALRPGLWGLLYRLWNDTYIYQWSAWRGSNLLGVVAWQSMPMYTDNLWLSVPPDAEDEVVSALLLHVRRRHASRRPLSLDFPAERFVQAIQAAGLSLHQTLIWMSINLSP